MIPKFLLLLVLCATSSFSCELTTDEQIFELIVRYRYAQILDQGHLIARISINDKDPRPVVLKKINRGIKGYFAAHSDFADAKKEKVYREFNMGQIEVNGDVLIVYATEGEMPPAYLLLQFRIEKKADKYEVVSFEKHRDL